MLNLEKFHTHTTSQWEVSGLKHTTCKTPVRPFESTAQCVLRLAGVSDSMCVSVCVFPGRNMLHKHVTQYSPMQAWTRTVSWVRKITLCFFPLNLRDGGVTKKKNRE